MNGSCWRGCRNSVGVPQVCAGARTWVYDSRAKPIPNSFFCRTALILACKKQLFISTGAYPNFLSRCTRQSHEELTYFQRPCALCCRTYNHWMRKLGMNFEAVRRIGTALPGVEESTAYGMPALKIRGKLLAALPANRSVEPNSLVVCVSSDQRDELLAADPDVYYLTEHYEGYDNVLVRLSQITAEMLQGLLMMAHKYRTSSGRRPPR